MGGATHPREITGANAKWSLYWSLRERVSNRSGWNGRECMPIHKWSQCWGAGKAQRGLGPQARVWREPSYREILAAECCRTDVERDPSV